MRRPQQDDMNVEYTMYEFALAPIHVVMLGGGSTFNSSDRRRRQFRSHALGRGRWNAIDHGRSIYSRTLSPTTSKSARGKINKYEKLKSLKLTKDRNLSRANIFVVILHGGGCDRIFLRRYILQRFVSYSILSRRFAYAPENETQTEGQL